MILCSESVVDRGRRVLGRDDLEWVSFPNRLDMASQRIRDARCQVLDHWEIGTDPLNYLLPLARPAPCAVHWLGHSWHDRYAGCGLLSLQPAHGNGRGRAALHRDPASL